MMRTVVLWAIVLAVGAFALQQLQYAFFVRMFSREIYVALIAVAFAALGIWLGWRLSPRRTGEPFARNTAALASLGLTGQEVKVLEALAAGRSNKEIARALGLSPNTVKTHLANLFGKLQVSRRTQAILRARELSLIP
jgi:DNA-binding CsgD family transcriptional regulator